MEAKRRIHKFDFEAEKMASGAKTHVALVDKAANLTEALVMKASTYVSIKTEVEEYDDEGGYSCDTDVIRIRDHGGDTIYVTEERVSIVESTQPRINIV